MLKKKQKFSPHVYLDSLYYINNLHGNLTPIGTKAIKSN